MPQTTNFKLFESYVLFNKEIDGELYASLHRVEEKLYERDLNNMRLNLRKILEEILIRALQLENEYINLGSVIRRFLDEHPNCGDGLRNALFTIQHEGNQEAHFHHVSDEERKLGNDFDMLEAAHLLKQMYTVVKYLLIVRYPNSNAFSAAEFDSQIYSEDSPNLQ